jgi:hypothetical protein
VHDLVDPELGNIIELISATTTETELKIRAERDTEWYETGVKISDAEMNALPLTRHSD